MGKDGSFASSNADFERFVYADVADEPNGMELRVLAAVCRGGASIRGKKLNGLRSFPPFAVADGLAQILRAVPSFQALRLDVTVTAERLVALLPVRGRRH